jgi:hypothetical protein
MVVLKQDAHHPPATTVLGADAEGCFLLHAVNIPILSQLDTSRVLWYNAGLV